MKKELIISILLGLALISFVYASTFIDNSESDFNNGTYINTLHNGTGVLLSGDNITGTFTSRIFEANESQKWDNISWITRAPYNKELPDNKDSEDAIGGIDMDKNLLLLHMDETSGTIQDSSGEDNDGTSQGEIVYSSEGKINTALGFTGTSNSYLVLDNMISFKASDSWTASFWANKTPGDTCGALPGTCGMIMGKRGVGSDFIWLWTDNMFRYRNSAGFSFDFTQVQNFEGWHHYALVANGTEAKLYLDGEYNSTVAGTTTLNVTTIGDAHTASYVMKGTLDEIALWNRSLSNEEIYNIYSRGAYKLNLSVRSCDDSSCIGESFNHIGDNPPPVNLSIANNTYFQYKFNFSSDKAGDSPLLYNVTINSEYGEASGDIYSPVVTLNLPEDEFEFNNTNNVTFNVSASDDTDLDNCTLYTDISGSWLANETKEFSGMLDSDTWEMYNLSKASYTWNAYCCDNSSNCDWSSSNSTFIIDYPESTYEVNISFESPTPEDEENISDDYIEINASINTLYLKEAGLNWNGTNYTLYNDSLIFMMNFDNVSAIGESSAKVVDLISGNNATTRAGTTWTSEGKHNGAYSFAADTNSYMTLNSEIGFADDEPWTIGFWADKTDTSTHGMILGDGLNAGFIWMYPNNYFRFRNSTGTGTVGNLDFTSVTDFSGWHHYSLVANETSLALYVDGELSSSLDGNTAFNITEISSYYSSGQYTFGGKIDEIRIWNRSLSSDETKQVYYSNLNKYDSDKWLFYSKQENLENGSYSFFTYAKSTSDSFNATETRTINVNTTNGSSEGIGTISLTWPVKYVTVQRDSNNKSDIILVGTYTGNATSIEARFNGGEWQTVVASPSGGTFNTNLSNQSMGQGILELRFGNDNLTNVSVEQIGIGDVYAIAGQSNAEMRGINTQYYNTSLLYNATVYREDDAWLIANDPVDTGTSIGSCWPLLANHMVENTNVPIAFVSAARGGSSILEWQKGGLYYEVLTNQIYEATRGTNYIKGVLFFQGETDIGTSLGGTKGNYDAYKGNLSQLAADLKDDVNMDRLIVGQVDIYYGGNRTTNDNIRKAQQDSWDENENITYGPVTYDIGLLPDNVHFKTDAQLTELAKRYWAAVEENYYGGSNGRGPRLQSAEYNSVTSKLRLTFDKTLNQTTGTEGWRIISGETILTDSNIIGVEVSDSFIELTLDTEIGENSTVSLGSYDDGHNKNVLRDTSEYDLPAEMIFSSEINLTPMNISFISPTPSNGSTIEDSFVEIKANIALNASEVRFNWDMINYTFYDNHTKLMYNFDNVSEIGENSTQIVDLSENANNGLLNGVVINSSGKYNNSAYFDGVNDYANVSHDDSLNFASKNFTIELWIKREASGRKGILVKTDPSGTIDSSDGYALYFDESNLLGFVAQNSEINSKSDETITSSDGWTHLIVVVERLGNLSEFYSNNVSYYKNGQLIGEKETLGLGTEINSSYDLIIGLEQYTDDYFKGHIDELRIYDKALSEEEVLQHYSSNLNKYEENAWMFYTNQTNLTTRVYNYSVFAKENDSWAGTELRTLNVSLSWPVSVTNLANQSQGIDFIYWNWTNPLVYFDEAIIYINGENIINTSDNYYNATGLSQNTTYTITVHTKDSLGNVNNTDVNSSATTLLDTFAPTILSTYPESDEVVNISTFKISLVTDENSICRYSTSDVNWSNMTQMPTTDGVQHNLSVSLSNGNYNYYFLCEDDYSNRMNSSYHLYFVVNSEGAVCGNGVCELGETCSSCPGDCGDCSTPGGGGGGSSKKIIITNVSNLSLVDLSIEAIPNVITTPGESKKFLLHAKNTGTLFLNDCSIKATGANANWISANIVKDLSAGEEYEFIFNVNIPSDAKAGEYKLKIGIVCKEITAEREFIVDILEQKLLFEILKVEKETKNTLKITYSMKELFGIEQNVNIQFLLYDYQNNKILEALDNRVISSNSEGEYSAQVQIDKNLKGNFRLLANINSETYSDVIEEDVVLGSTMTGLTIFTDPDKKDLVISGIFIFLFLAFVIFITKRIIEARRKKNRMNNIIHLGHHR